MKILSIFTLFVFQMNSAFAGGYDTLPAGINTIVAKQVNTTRIESRYGADQQTAGLNIKQEFTSSNLQNISDAVNLYFKQLNTISPDAYNQFSLGEFKATGWAEVKAQGYGIGHGITDHLTILASLPVYHVKTNIDFTQSKKSNIAAIRNIVSNVPTTSSATNFAKELTNQLPETNEELLQSLIVNMYGYKPLGHFERDALGDAEIGMIYRLTDYADKGQAIAFGAVLPTGKIDDPDSLQDISTGDGQYDAYLESLSGVSFFDNTFQLDFKIRYTYQFESEKRLRLITDSSIPLSSESMKLREKLGNKLDTTITATINPTIWLNVNASLIVNKVDKTRYNIENQKTKSIMENNTDSLNKWSRIGIGFSGIELYKRKKLDIPFDVNFSYQRILSAKNAPDFERIDADIHLYF